MNRYIEQNYKPLYDLLLKNRQIEFDLRVEPEEWKYCALSQNKIGDWNKWGFGLWNKDVFRKDIDKKLEKIKSMPENEPIQISEKFKPEEPFKSFEELAESPQETFIWVNDNHIKSLITGHIIRTPGNQQQYEEYYKTHNDYCRYFWDGEKWCDKRAQWHPIPVPAIEWHRLTNFAKIKEVYDYARPLYDAWKAAGLIPQDKLVEEEPQWNF